MFFWDSRVGRALAAVFGAVALFAMVLFFGSLQNDLLWEHVTPQSFNEWATVVLAGVAGAYGAYLGATGQIGD